MEEDERGTFWRGTVIDSDTRLRVGRAIGKDEDEVATQLMAQLKARGHPDAPPAIATDGCGSYREAMIETWGQVPAYSGRGQPPTRKQAKPDWHYLQVVKHRSGNRLMGITIKVIYGDPEEVRALLGEHTAYVERTHLTSRQMNGRLVRKTLSFSKALEMLEAACAWEDWVYNLTRPVKTLRLEISDDRRRWQPRSPGMVAGLTDHIWTIQELLTAVVAPDIINTK
ncbi:MAG: transposase [Candidatus Bipolaricaulia bacterium]